MNSFLAYLGGKSILSRKIVKILPEHTTYVEVFAGAAWLLFRKPPEISKTEIINDINTDLVTLYRVIKYHLEEFIKTFKWMLVAREEYERLKVLPPDALTDIQRAARFYYLLRLNYGAKVDNYNFNVSLARKPRINLLRIEENLSDAHLRLSGVYVERLPYGELIRRYDRPDTFFYLDPPYWNCENCYGKGIFNKGDFNMLAEQLNGIQGKFIMSINDVKEIRGIFRNFRIEEVETSYLVANKRPKSITELLIMNY